MGLYPIVGSAFWIAGGVLFRMLDEPNAPEPPTGGWPGVSVLIPAYNEAQVIGACVHAVRAVDSPRLEVLVLDDGSTDATVEAAEDAAADDERVTVVRDRVNRGKGERLNLGFGRARHDLVLVTDADTHLHRLAIKLLVARMSRSTKVAAVAGAPHVTNRRNLLCGMQIIEVASIVGLIRRTQALSGRVGVVAGVLGLFRRDAVIAAGGYRGDMATEDIDLSWRLLLAGWHTSYEPQALVGMEVPTTLGTLWSQRRRWASGQGEVLHVHLRELLRWRHRHLWPLALEGTASLLWVLLLPVSYLVTGLFLAAVSVEAPSIPLLGLMLAWGTSIAVVAMIQLTFALRLDFPYDRLAALTFLLGPIYPIAYWMLTTAAAARAELPALVRGPGERHVVWDVPRERVGDGS